MHEKSLRTRLSWYRLQCCRRRRRRRRRRHSNRIVGCRCLCTQVSKRND